MSTGTVLMLTVASGHTVWPLSSVWRKRPRGKAPTPKQARSGGLLATKTTRTPNVFHATHVTHAVMLCAVCGVLLWYLRSAFCWCTVPWWCCREPALYMLPHNADIMRTRQRCFEAILTHNEACYLQCFEAMLTHNEACCLQCFEAMLTHNKACCLGCLGCLWVRVVNAR